MKTIKVLLDDNFIGTTPIVPTNNIGNLKEYGNILIKKYNKDPNSYVTDIYLDPQNKLDLTKVNNDLVLAPYWNSFTDPIIHVRLDSVRQPETNYQDLPPDMRRYLIEKVEPIQALELCKTVTCDYDRLLNINYDFVTQSFAPGNTSREKFIYLASRVSKNINNNPEIIFVHFNGRPMGTKRFYQIDEADEDNEEIRHDREEVMNIITSGLFNTLAVEWYYQDEHNMWIKVNKPNELPRTFEGPIKQFNGRQQQKILRDNDVYDYPLIRAEVLKKTRKEYPGTVNITNDVIKNMIYKITQLYYPESKISSDVVNDAAEDYILDWYASDITPGYNTYMMMNDGYTRSEAEVFSNAYYRNGSFSDNLKVLYGYDVDRVL